MEQKSFTRFLQCFLFWINETLTYFDLYILFFPIGWKMPELGELKDKNALCHETRVPWILPFYV